MLPLITLNVCDTGVVPDLSELVKKAQEAKNRRSKKLNDNGEFEVHHSEHPRVRGDANVGAEEVLRKVAERGARVADNVARKAERDAEQAREREAHAEALAAQLELSRAEVAFEARSDTEEDETDSSSNQSDVVSISPDDEDERGIDELDKLFDDMEEYEALKAQRFLAVDRLDSIYAHLQEALAEINATMDAMENDDQRTILFGVATRLKADMRILFAVRRAILSSSDPLLRSPQFRGDMQRVDDLVREATAEQQADGTGGSPNATATRWNSVVLPLLGMLVFLLSAYMFPGMATPYPVPDAEELPVVYKTVLPFLNYVNTKPTALKAYRNRFHKASLRPLVPP